MTYIIKRNNKRFNNKVFACYEQARSYVRKWLRKAENLREDVMFPCDKGWVQHANPSITEYGFSIKAKG